MSATRTTHTAVTVTKRDGRVVPYDRTKIAATIHKAFTETQTPIDAATLERLVDDVETELWSAHVGTVEHIQDLVELTLMTHGHYDVAKAYILYRSERTKARSTKRQIHGFFPDAPDFDALLDGIDTDFAAAAYPLAALERKYRAFHTPDKDLDTRLSMLVRAATELIAPDAPDWEHIAARIYGYRYTCGLARAWTDLADAEPFTGSDTHTDTDTQDAHNTPAGPTFAQKVRRLHAMGLYGDAVHDAYTDAELTAAAGWINPAHDHLLTISGYELLVSRYVIRSKQHVSLESVQEMFLGIALFLAIPEGTDKMDWARRIYSMLSTLKVTMATPTLANARKQNHQLSSCFIDTVPDDLKGIYRSITNFANVSKYGGGMGLYFGKVRARGSSIRGFEGAAGGVIRWIRLANDTAVAVDQLGVRQGACACYLDVWHKDLPEFLDLRTNNGDDRMKAHDIFPGICYPDYFWEQVRSNMNGDWGLLCPHEVQTKKGYALEDSYGEEWTRRYLDCLSDPDISKRWIPVKDLVRLIIHSLIETGTPFTFNRDAVNRANPNRHEGIIYCSNLCTEIAQNQSPAQEATETITTDSGESVIVTRVVPGDYVVCNLASLNLGRIDVTDDEALADVIATVVRALDNVITLNDLPVPDAEVTNRRYRAIGLGVSGYHHMLATHGIIWESEDHLTFVDRIFERINYHTIRASHTLAAEKGAYPLFPSSDCQTGRYFTERGYTGTEWDALRAEVAADGLRNGYLLAVAPTASTSIISGTTAGIDPLMERFYYDEKKSGLIARVAPDLSPETYWLYKGAYHMDQSWSIRAGGIRTRHIDQASSMNLYITHDYSFRKILDLYLLAAEEGVKTVYYVRSKSLEVEDCESCAS